MIFVRESLKKNFEVKVNFKEPIVEKILLEKVEVSFRPEFDDPLKLVDEFRKTSLWRLYKVLVKAQVLRFIFNKIFFTNQIIKLKLKRIQNGLQALYEWLLFFIGKSKNLRFKRIVSLKKYVKQNKIPTIAIAKKNFFYLRVLDNIFTENVNKVGPVIFRNYPQVYIAILSNANVIGHSSLVISGQNAIASDDLSIKHDLLPEEKHKNAVVYPNINLIEYVGEVKERLLMKEGAFFLHGCAANYAHWITEVLPQIISFCSIAKVKDVPLILNSGLPKTILETVGLMVGNERPVIFLEPFQEIYVEKLYLTSSMGYIPYERRYPLGEDGRVKFDSKSRFDGFFNPLSLRLLRKKIFSKLSQELVDADWPSKIYLRRNGGLRKLINQHEVEEYLKGQGFVIISPEDFTFLEQVSIFKNAKIIISPTGAGLANAIFCNPKYCKVGVLMSSHPDMIFGYWANLLSPIAIESQYLFASNTKAMGSSLHSDFVVNIRDLHKLVISLMNSND